MLKEYELIKQKFFKGKQNKIRKTNIRKKQQQQQQQQKKKANKTKQKIITDILNKHPYACMMIFLTDQVLLAQVSINQNCKPYIGLGKIPGYPPGDIGIRV